MTTNTWRVLLVDDDPEIHATVATYSDGQRSPDGRRYAIESVSNFDEALRRLVNSPPDLVILDVRNFHTRADATDDEPAEDDVAGRRLYERLSEHRFVPVVFYTAVEHLVSDLHQPPLRSVLAKTVGLRALFEALDGVIDSGLPGLLRDLESHVAAVICRYVGDYVRGQWQTLSAAGVTSQHLGRQLVELLAVSLRHAVADGTDSDLARRLSVGDEWHPAEYYIHPPLGTRLDTGDIVRIEPDLYGIVVTPSCTLEHQKYDTLNMIGASPLHNAASTRDWLAQWNRPTASRPTTPPPGTKDVRDIIKGRSVRYFYLPAYLDIVPDMVIDVEQTIAVPREDTAALQRVTSLSERYRAALLAQRERYYQRIGLTDPPVDRILDSLREPADLPQE